MNAKLIKHFIELLVIFCSTGIAFSQVVDKNPPKNQISLESEAHSIIALWGHMVPGQPEGICQETYRYSASGTSYETSGNSQTQGQWSVDKLVDAAGYSKMTVRILQHNGQRDCAKAIPPTGVDFPLLVRVHSSGNWMELCGTVPDRRVCIVLWKLIER